jgi:hypothetical protein
MGLTNVEAVRLMWIHNPTIARIYEGTGFPRSGMVAAALHRLIRKRELRLNIQRSGARSSPAGCICRLDRLYDPTNHETAFVERMPQN